MSGIDTNKLLEEVNAIDAEDAESADGVVDVSDEIKYLQQLPELEKRNREEKRQLKNQLKSAEDLNDKYIQLLAAHGINPDGTKVETSKSTFSNLTSTTLSSMTPSTTITFSSSSNLQHSPQQSIQTQTTQQSNDTFSTPTSKSTTGMFSISPSTPLTFDSFDLENNDSDSDFLDESTTPDLCASSKGQKEKRVHISKRVFSKTKPHTDTFSESKECQSRKSRRSNKKNKEVSKHNRRHYYNEYSNSEYSDYGYSDYSDYSDYYDYSYDDAPKHKSRHCTHVKNSSKGRRSRHNQIIKKARSKQISSSHRSRTISRPRAPKEQPQTQIKDAQAILADFEKFAAAKMEEMEQMINDCSRKNPMQTTLDEMAANARYKENIRKVETALYCHPHKMDIIAEVKAQFAAAMRKEGVLTMSTINCMIERAANAVINSV